MTQTLVARRAIAVAGLVVLASILVSVPPLARSLTGIHTAFAGLSMNERERAAGVHEDMNPIAWDVIRSEIPHRGRYVVVGQASSSTEASRENLVTGTYASYWLLPAVQVTSLRDADVAILVNPAHVPRHARCFPGRWRVCVIRLR